MSRKKVAKKIHFKEGVQQWLDGRMVSDHNIIKTIDSWTLSLRLDSQNSNMLSGGFSARSTNCFAKSLRHLPGVVKEM